MKSCHDVGGLEGNEGEEREGWMGRCFLLAVLHSTFTSLHHKNIDMKQSFYKHELIQTLRPH